MRKPSFSIFTVLILAILFKSCKIPTGKTSSPTITQQKKEKEIIKPASGPYNASNTQEFDLLHTKLEVNFDWAKQQLNGTATLKLKPYFYPQNILELDAKGMEIHSVKLSKNNLIKTDNPKNKEVLGNNKLDDLKYSYNKKVIRINLDKTYTRKDSLKLVIKYTAKPNELPKGGSQAITEDKGLYFINPDGSDKNKPKQIWTQGETEASSVWFPTIDSPNERTTQEMFITVDTGYAVLSNGENIYTLDNGNGTQTSYWKMDKPHAPYLFMMAIGKFAVVEDEMPENGKYDWKNLELKYYVEPKYAPFAKNIFGNTPEMIAFFSEKLGYKYPWPKYSQVVVRDYVSGAMENTSATIFMEAVQSDNRELMDENWDGIIAHELFHHWFGDLVTCESWANLPLNESFANYSEYLWYEHKYGLNEAEYQNQKEKAEYFNEATTKQEPLIRYHYLNKEDLFDRHSYNKGGRILHMLRKVVGDEAFFESLQLYLKRNEFTSVESDELRLAFEDVTGLDLNWFFNQWFYKPGHPILKVEHTYSPGQVKLKVSQVQDTTYTPVYRLPVTIDVWENGMKKSQKIFIDKAVQEFTIPVLANPQLVYFDPENHLLAEIKHSKSSDELAFQYEAYNDFYLPRYNALNTLFENKTSKSDINKTNTAFAIPQNTQLLGKALEDKFWVIRGFALDQFLTYSISNIENYIKKIESIALTDPKPEVRAKAILALSKYNNKAYVHVYEKGLTEKPYSVAGASLSAYLKASTPAQANKVASEFEQYDNINIVIPMADFYTDKQDKSKYLWFKQQMTSGDVRKIYNLLNPFGQYLMFIDGAEKEDGKKILSKIAAESKYEVIKSVANTWLQIIK